MLESEMGFNIVCVRTIKQMKTKCIENKQKTETELELKIFQYSSV